MKPDRHDFERTIVGGLAATLIVAVLMYLAPLIPALPNIDMAAALGDPISGHVALQFTMAWWIGLGAFFVVGGVLSPLIFVYAFAGLMGSAWLRGVEWAVFLWVVGGVGVMTGMGLGFNEGHAAHPVTSVLLTLAAHIIYGAVLGQIAGGALVHLQHKPAAA
ncbi:MAG TPA: DUF6789 family protein [Bryobacteraceae bacterium]|nr:DUF6789 family protein [Bryobacteraceae bacterium]